jgi:hypothetical protein
MSRHPMTLTFFQSDILSELATVQEGQVLAPKFVSAKRQRDDKSQRPQQPQVDTPSSSQPRPQKPRPTRQPRGWPPASPTSPSVIPPPPQTLESDRRKSTGSFSEHDQSALFAAHPQYPGSHLSSSESPTTAGNNWDLSHLVLAQMNFHPAPQSFSSSISQRQDLTSPFANSYGGAPPTLPLDTRMTSAFFNETATSPISGHNQLVDVTQDMTALWSDAPSDFK